jgi:uncharacterized protein
MGDRTSYTPGTFSWTDLTTPEQAAAKAFYVAVFGWEVSDFPIGEDAVYSSMSIDGKPVAAISPQPQFQLDAGVPPLWNSYITVESADAAVARALELGADVSGEAFDVFEFGRMAGITDPQGAFFLVWEPNSHIGASLVNAPGALTWNELASTDPDGSAEFYSDLFGWEVTPAEGLPMEYLMIHNAAGAQNGGIRPMLPQERPHWLVYFGTDDIEACVATAEEHGGSELVEPTDIGVGKFAVVSDPQGGFFALFTGDFDD